QTHLAFVKGDISGESSDEPVLVRVHSECLTGDIFSSIKCDCGPQLNEAMRRVA
ncbi:MAG TPA: bifunctional 3,4-dihydroxy-2-butanone-4-phosphate synthase/GTP cyclohydrolase II, partial [Acidimicrobiaceae bacterium]|nr:bifunctional 3,4-dihydroxy-2-butanone-4-phosphate synthase/GTP cyclohydrolase II [Acidimicrobiaceae bacterium]